MKIIKILAFITVVLALLAGIYYIFKPPTRLKGNPQAEGSTTEGITGKFISSALHGTSMNLNDMTLEERSNALYAPMLHPFEKIPDSKYAGPAEFEGYARQRALYLATKMNQILKFVTSPDGKPLDLTMDNCVFDLRINEKGIDGGLTLTNENGRYDLGFGENTMVQFEDIEMASTRRFQGNVAAMTALSMEPDYMGTNGVLTLAQQVLSGLGFRADNTNYYSVKQEIFMGKKVPGYNVIYAPPKYKNRPIEAVSKFQFKVEILANVPGGKVILVYNPWRANLGEKLPEGFAAKVREYQDNERR